MLKGIKHLVKCRCVLTQFRNLQEPPRHQFVVFSVYDDTTDVVQSKYVQCNNCGIVHKVIDLCKSEFMNKEDMPTLTSISDIKDTIPENLRNILDRNAADLPSWEAATFVYHNKQWGELVIITSDYDSGTRHGKYVQILGENLFRVESFSREEIAKVGS